MADTKRKFVEAYRFPVPAVYGNVLQELLVAQHLARYNVNYAYSAVRGAPLPRRGHAAHHASDRTHAPQSRVAAGARCAADTRRVVRFPHRKGAHASLSPAARPQVAALGFCSVYDQLMEGFSQPENKDAIFKCARRAAAAQAAARSRPRKAGRAPAGAAAAPDAARRAAGRS